MVNTFPFCEESKLRDKVIWRCTSKKTNCKARIHMLGTNVVAVKGMHNHPPRALGMPQQRRPNSRKMDALAVTASLSSSISVTGAHHEALTLEPARLEWHLNIPLQIFALCFFSGCRAFFVQKSVCWVGSTALLIIVKTTIWVGTTAYFKAKVPVLLFSSLKGREGQRCHWHRDIRPFILRLATRIWGITGTPRLLQISTECICHHVCRLPVDQLVGQPYNKTSCIRLFRYYRNLVRYAVGMVRIIF